MNRVLGAGHHSAVGERGRDMALADAARAEEHDVLCSLDEGQRRKFLDLCSRCTAREGEVLLERFNRGERSERQQRLPGVRSEQRLR